MSEEVTGLRERARAEAVASQSVVLSQLSAMEQQLSDAPPRIEAQPSAGAASDAASNAAARRKLQTPDVEEDQAYLDGLLSDFLNKGADLRAG